MDIFVLDDKFVPIELVEGYESVAWTERFAENGEFEIITPSTPDNKAQLRVGTYLGADTTPVVMRIETVEDNYNEDGVRLLTVTGRSLEYLFTKRVARKYFLMMDEDEVWKFNNKTPVEIARTLVDDICIKGVLSSHDIIPGLKKGWVENINYYPSENNFAFPHIPITMEIGLKTLEEAVHQAINGYPLGYRIYRDMNSIAGNLYFDVYTGTDRTMNQTKVDPVVFSLPWGTLKSSSDIDSIADYQNVVYVFSKYQVVMVPDTNLYSGMDRNVTYLYVPAEEVDQIAGETLMNYLKHKGQVELDKHKREALFEGEVPDDSPYLYNRDYFLGDHVDLLGEDGVGAKMSVVENIITIDVDGFRSFPTLKMEEHIDPDSWSGQRGGQVWASIPGVWRDYR